jgi:hypothetical protein
VNFATLIPALKTWAAEALELSEGAVLWANEERGFTGDLFLELSIPTTTRIGMDWTTTRIEGDQQIPVRLGVREFVLQVEIQSDSQDPRDLAVQVAESLRTRGALEELLAGTKAANLALVDVGDAQTADVEVDGRMVSRAAVPVRWRTVSVFEATQHARDTIATADPVASTFNR